jgi:hypothetical protein
LDSGSRRRTSALYGDPLFMPFMYFGGRGFSGLDGIVANGSEMLLQGPGPTSERARIWKT